MTAGAAGMAPGDPPVLEPPAVTAPPDGAAEQRGWKVFAVTGLGVLLCFLNSSTLQVALPTLARAFDASPAEASWILLAYMLVNTVCILTFGRLSDLLGRRRLYLLGLVVFMAGCLGCALAPGIGFLIAARMVQGLGAAAIIANNVALLADAFPKHVLSVALGYNTMISAVAQVSGPAVGGALIGVFGWQAVFLFNLPFGLLALGLGLRLLPPGTGRRRERFDGPGAALSVLLLGGLVLALGGQGRGWDDPLRLGAGAVALLALPAFLLSQLRRPHPLVDLYLFRDRILAACFTSVTLVNAAQAGTGLVFAFFLQTVQGHDAFGAGWRVMALALGMVTAAPIVARLVRRFPAQLLGAAGAALMAVALLILLVTLSPELPDGVLLAALFATGFGNACFMSTCTGTVMHQVMADRRGMANGLRSTLQNTGTLIGTAICAGFVVDDNISSAIEATHSLGNFYAALVVLVGITLSASIIMARSRLRDQI